MQFSLKGCMWTSPALNFCFKGFGCNEFLHLTSHFKLSFVHLTLTWAGGRQTVGAYFHRVEKGLVPSSSAPSLCWTLFPKCLSPNLNHPLLFLPSFATKPCLKRNLLLSQRVMVLFVLDLPTEVTFLFWIFFLDNCINPGTTALVGAD